MSSHAALLLAAGFSRRLGYPKALLQVDGETLLHRTARLLLSTQPQVCVVMLATHSQQMMQQLHDLPVQCMLCAQPQQGMSASLREGLAGLPVSVDAVLVTPCDLPKLSAEHLNELVNRWRAQPQHAVASAYQGVIGTPAVLPRRAFAALQQLRGDRGARDWLRAQQDVVTITNEELAFDVDVAEDLPANG